MNETTAIALDVDVMSEVKNLNINEEIVIDFSSESSLYSHFALDRDRMTSSAHF